MVASLDEDLLDYLAVAFRLRLLGAIEDEQDHVWNYYIIPLLRKKLPLGQALPTARNCRPTALLPAIYKLYMMCLIILAGPGVYDLVAPQFAFRPTHQAGEVVFILRRN